MARGARNNIWFIDRNDNSILDMDEDSKDEEDEDYVDDRSSTDSTSHRSEHDNTPSHTYPTHHPIAGLMEN